MLGFNETIDQLAMPSSVHWHSHVLTRALNFEVGGQRKKGRLKRTWKRQVEKESVKVGLRGEDSICWSNWSVGVILISAGLR